MLLRPFTTTTDTNGNGVIVIQHTIAGIVWRVVQIGFALGQLAPSPQLSAHLNSIPFVTSYVMTPSVFSLLPGQPPFAMEGVFYGPPYPVLSSGDSITIGVTGSTPGDTFTAGVFLEELVNDGTASMVG